MIGWVDAQAGASGDMLLGALVDAGVPLSVLQDEVDRLGLGIALTATATSRAGLGATKVDVLAHEDGTTRTWADVRSLIESAPPVAQQAFQRLAEAEAAIHRVPVDQVHFHEVGALDALADVAGVAAGFAYLDLERVHCSTVSLGSGTTRGAHGPLPVPAPAVLALLAGAPVTAGPSPYEATTPTGAALLAAVVTDWGPLPAMIVTRTGYGAGGRDPGEVANVLRLVLGEPATPPDNERGEPAAARDDALLLETNVDDLDPRLWPLVLTRLMEAGASDAWLTPILMKKGRPAHTLSVLCPATSAAALRAVIFRETSTIGLREIAVGKHALHRTERTIFVDGQPVRIKTSWLDGEPVTQTPEWEDVAAAAQALSRPAKAVLAAAVELARPR